MLTVSNLTREIHFAYVIRIMDFVILQNLDFITSIILVNFSSMLIGSILAKLSNTYKSSILQSINPLENLSENTTSVLKVKF